MSAQPERKAPGRQILDGAFVGLAFVTLAAITASATRSAFFREPIVTSPKATLLLYVELRGDDRIDDFRRVERFDQSSLEQCQADRPALLKDLREAFKGLTVQLTCVPGAGR